MADVVILKAAADDYTVALAVRAKRHPWPSGLTTAHEVDRRKRRGFPGATISASGGASLYPKPALSTSETEALWVCRIP